MIDALVIYGGYCIVVTVAVLLWFAAGERLLERRDVRRRARILVEMPAALEVRPGLYMVPEPCRVIDARERFAARRVDRYPTGGNAA